MDFQWGSVPGWFEAVGTVGAFAVALTLLFKQLQAYRDAEEDRRLGPARAVAAWHEYEGERCRIFVRNAGEAPVYSTVTYWTPNTGPKAGQTLETVFGVVAPGVTVDSLLPEAWVDAREYIQPGLGLEVAFTDSAGRHWRRTADGELRHEPHRALTC